MEVAYSIGFQKNSFCTPYKLYLSKPTVRFARYELDTLTDAQCTTTVTSSAQVLTGYPKEVEMGFMDGGTPHCHELKG